MKKIKSIYSKLCCNRAYRLPRKWSNKELSKFADLFSGSIINVSAWRDEDKEGKRYRDYFTKRTTYMISNTGGERGLSNMDDEINIDLEDEINTDFVKKFDVVFNHTTLEHIYRVDKAFDNLCLLSKDIVILVVPFFQEQHYNNSYGDYWRFTPEGILRNFKERGFRVLYLSTTPFENNSIYIFAIATRNFDKWQQEFSPIDISTGKIDGFARCSMPCLIINKIYNFLKNK